MSGMMTLQQAADWLTQSGMAVKVVGDTSVCIARVHTDTRSLQPGDLFVDSRGLSPVKARISLMLDLLAGA